MIAWLCNRCGHESADHGERGCVRVITSRRRGSDEERARDCTCDGYRNPSTRGT